MKILISMFWERRGFQGVSDTTILLNIRIASYKRIINNSRSETRLNNQLNDTVHEKERS